MRTLQRIGTKNTYPNHEQEDKTSNLSEFIEQLYLTGKHAFENNAVKNNFLLHALEIRVLTFEVIETDLSEKLL